ncbi:MAG: TonB-dependent receptor domain-containing protein, partial [Candidatus Binatia bacterium]
EASDAAEKARSLEPNEPAVLTTLGFILLSLRETQTAVVTFEKVLEVGPTSGEPYLGLGLALFRQGRTEEGLRFFQEAVLMEPRVSLFHSYLGKALYQLGRREDALRSLDRAHLLDPKDPTPELYKGVFQTDLNRPAVAIEALQRSVTLNDNRAIYRSRLLLDRDLAMRNVNLTRAYLDLGQQERALATGILALHEDPQSSSAHLFYGSTIFSLFREARSGLSELLQTRILQPVNQNTFNTFNDYTSILEQPRIQGTAEATGGNLDSQGGSLSLTGGTTRLAGAHFLNYSRTDGPKSKNSDERAWASDAFVKFATSPRSSLLLEFFHFDDRGGDIFLNRRGFTRNDPDLTRNNHTTFVGLGYQIQTRPENNLLLYAQGQSQHFRTRDPVPFNLDSTLDQPFYSLQAAYLHRIMNHQLWIAAEYFGGEPRERLRFPAIPTASFTDRIQQQFVSLNFQDVWQVRPDLYLTGALRYDYARDRIIGSELRQNSNLVSPQFGLIWRLSPDNTIRMAAFRAFQTPNPSRLLPSHVAGFFNTTTVESSARSWQYNFAWDADFTPTTFFTLGAFHRD